MLQVESAVQPHRPLAAPVSPAPQPQGLGNLPARGKGKGKAGGGASSSLVSQVKQVQVQSPQPSPAKGLLMLQVEALVLLSKGIFQLLAGLLAAGEGQMHIPQKLDNAVPADPMRV